MKLQQQYRSHKQESVGRETANAKWLCGTSVAPRVSNFMGEELYTVDIHTVMKAKSSLAMWTLYACYLIYIYVGLL